MIDSKQLKPNIPSSKLLEIPQEFGWGLSDDFSTPLSGMVESDRIVGNFECSDVRLTLNSGDTTSVVSVDIFKNSVSIFDILPSIDISGTTNVGATTPFLFITSATTITFLDDDRIDIIVSGATDCIGLKVKLIGNQIIN